MSRPDLTTADPVQKIGDPKVRSYRLFVNSSLDVTDSSQVYLFANYGLSKQQLQFYYRQPVTAIGPVQSGIGAATYARSSVFNPIYLDQLADGTWDAAGRTFSLLSVYPSGFTPYFKGNVTDVAITGGYKANIRAASPAISAQVTGRPDRI